MNSMTDLEHDLELSLEWWTPNPRFEDDTEVDCEETAKNLTKLGYQKIVWHKITDEKIPLEDGKDVLVIDSYGNYWVAKYVEAINWFAIYEMDWPYKFIAWTELPKFNK